MPIQNYGPGIALRAQLSAYADDTENWVVPASAKADGLAQRDHRPRLLHLDRLLRKCRDAWQCVLIKDAIASSSSRTHCHASLHRLEETKFRIKRSKRDNRKNRLANHTKISKLQLNTGADKRDEYGLNRRFVLNYRVHLCRSPLFWASPISTRPVSSKPSTTATT